MFSDPYFFFWWINLFLYTLISNLLIRYLNILQNASSKSILFSFLFICAVVSNAPWRVTFCENVSIIWIINATKSLIQNVISQRKVCLCWFIFYILNEKMLETMLIFARQVSWKWDWSSKCVISEMNSLTPNIFNPLSVCSRSVKKIYQVEHFGRNLLKIYTTVY